MELMRYGYIPAADPPPKGLLPGRVIESKRGQHTLATDQGEVTAIVTGAFHRGAEARNDFPCVGDFVLIALSENGPSQIKELLPRRSKFSRADFLGHGAGYAKTIREQVVAANFDYVFILSSLGQLFKVSRVARYLPPAWQSGGQPVVILTKADLAPDTGAPVAEVERAAPGVPIHAISSRTGRGLEGLNLYLKPGKTAVFLGMSGVGKSSLVNALMERDVMAVRGVREDDHRGRHTTTHRQLFMLPSGAMIIDTPGMRELGLIGVDDGIRLGFADVEALFALCRFGDCGHESEPGCAIRAALADGTLSLSRWELYSAQRRENRFVQERAAFMRERREWEKGIAKYNKANQKANRRYGGKTQ